MSESRVSRAALAALVAVGTLAAATAGEDLSRYRDFQLGTDLTAVARKAGVNPSQAKVIHQRPALIQDLAWRPQFLGISAQSDPAQEVVFTFYGGELFRIVVNYGRYETEGLTAGDITDAISAGYGIPTKPSPEKTVRSSDGDQEEVCARWENTQYRFDLIRVAYGPSFKLVGILKGLEAPFQAATLEARRLDGLEEPQREAARKSSEEAATKATLDKARLLNKPRFRP